MSHSQLSAYKDGDCCGYSGNYTGGVGCNDFGRVHKIKWDFYDLNGSFNTTAWDALPLLTFSAVSNQISGFIPSLQLSLKYFYISKNKLQGKAPVLLPGMAEIGIDNNNLTGTVNFPSSLSYIYVMFNELQGSFSSFPSSAKDLYINNNMFSGELPSFPSSLVGFGLQNNNFSGVIPHFPNSLEVINLSGNRFVGLLPILPTGLLQLYIGFNNLIGPVPALPSSLFDISLESNQMNGTFPSAPAAISKFYINNNLFTGNVSVNAPFIFHIENNQIAYFSIIDISNLIECDISNNNFNPNTYLYLSSKCRLFGLNQINSVMDTGILASYLNTPSFSHSILHSSFTPLETTTNFALPSQQPAPPSGVTTNIWVVVGVAIGVLVGVNIAIQTIKVRLAKPIA